MKVECPAFDFLYSTSYLALHIQKSESKVQNAPPLGVDMADLKRKSVRGGAVTMVSQAITIGIQLTSTVVLARLLTPEDYGVLAMVMAVTAFAGLFRDLGLSSAAIQKKDLTREQQSNLFWLNVSMGLLLTLIVAAGSPLVAWFYKKPELVMVTLALAVNFLIGSLGTQHGAMLVRKMQFGRKAVATIAGAIVTLVVAVILALQDYSYWALVWGTLSGAVVVTLLTVIVSPFRPCLPSKGSGIREMLGFGANVTAFDFVNYFSRNLDKVLIGRFCSTESLGLYSRAYQLLMFPVNAIRGPITSVAFPAMSSLQDQPQAYRSYYRRTILLLSHLSMPLSAYLWVTSEHVVILALGKAWLPTASLFSILAITAFIQTPYSLTGLIQLTLGRGQRYFAIGAVVAGFTSLGFSIGVLWGSKGVASAYAITTYVGLVPILMWAFKNTAIRLRDFFESILRPCLASILSAIVCYLVMGKVSELASFWVLTITFSAFAFSYLIVLGLIPNGRDDVKWFVRLVRNTVVSR
ncbi:lipopolysaccharide biosynthesis protein [Akkermansiaceae bacterium]|nr:lipopolysaccharide biosynthesis protein [bacterium]MDB4142981.1 lipopolysaccharide biosynthesis protein [Akkermansiaceae bacterium]